ncbi:MAG: protein phosphatase 2C domain-containing protein [Actinomycetota bacterium]|nr:protein phosphatase 2C domain-containing protein [Actinomycetota bacterium]
MSALTMQPTVLSEVGLREHNEDAAFASPRLVAVADGVGGAAAGEVASRLAILKMIGLEKRRLVGSLQQELGAAVDDANAVIEFAALYEPRHAGMGTTLTAVALSNDGTYLVANVGDSRTYLLRNARVCRLTRDDSLMQELIDRGAITEVEARRHPRRSVVLEALDGGKRAPAAVRALQAQARDRLLLCSDGISDYLDDTELATLLSIGDAAIAARRLIDSALKHGSNDNLTAVVTDVISGRAPHEGWLSALPASDTR